MDNNLKMILQKQCQMSIGRFKDRVLYRTPWATRSILMSEGFAFCAVADFLDVDAIFESGIYNGRSTQMWANYFPLEVNIVAIDKRDFRRAATNRLAPYKNVTLLRGNGPTELNKLIAKFPEKRIGIFMDGPKGRRGVGFGKEALKKSNVVMVAIHDMSKIKGNEVTDGRPEFETWEMSKFLTEEEWFVKEYSWLDTEESQYDSGQKLTWHPYIIVSGKGKEFDRKLGSYGPTIGFAFSWGGE